MRGRGFVPAGSLKPDDAVSRAAAGSSSVVRLISDQSGTLEVLRVKNLTYDNQQFISYNLEVAERHTFFVGKEQAWVHNACVKAFDIVTYGTRAPGFEKHHAVMDVWAAANIVGYKSYGSATPTIVLTKAQHDLANAVYRDWLKARTGRAVGGSVDWKTVSNKEMQDLSDRMMRAAGVPDEQMRAYYQALNNYIYRDGK